jgi:hypothetical protein
MRDVLIEANHQPLDEALKCSLERTSAAFASLLKELLVILNRDTVEPEGLNLLRWAVLYVVVLRDVSRSAALLLNDGRHSRAALMLRRVVFEYHTRFRFLRMHPEHASTAMDEFQERSERFAKRIGSEDVTFVYDANFDRERFEEADKPYRNFEAICNAVYGQKAQEYYARFYSYPSSLLHGDVMMSMDVLKLEGDRWEIHLDSGRPFTNEIAGNLIVFLLDFAGDVVRTFEMENRALVDDIGVEFNERRKTIGLLDA